MQEVFTESLPDVDRDERVGDDACEKLLLLASGVFKRSSFSSRLDLSGGIRAG